MSYLNCKVHARRVSRVSTQHFFCRRLSPLETNRKCLVAYFDVAKAFDAVWIEGLFFQLYELGIRGKTWRILYNFYADFRCCVKVQGQISDWYSLQCGIHQGGFLSLLKYTVFINSLINELWTVLQVVPDAEYACGLCR